MARGIWGKIEWIREQPEHIRMRYVFGCLLVSMTFIVGIWLLSLQESFQGIGNDASTATLKGKEMLPNNPAPSLSNLLEKATPLRVDGQNEKTGQQYFEEQLNTKPQLPGSDTAEEPAP